VYVLPAEDVRYRDPKIRDFLQAFTQRGKGIAFVAPPALVRLGPIASPSERPVERPAAPA
jgi:hypothetical protein